MMKRLPGRAAPVIACVLTLALAIPSAAQPLPEASRWLRDYLRIDTTNPPGNEGAAATLLAEILHTEGIATRRFVSPEGRVSLYARLAAAAPGAGTLILMHHTDVVPAGDGWSVEPFDGAVSQGKLWGRGAIDAKSLGIAQLAAFVDLRRSRTPLDRNLVLLAVPDEEAGGAQGTGWLLEHHPELFTDIDGVLNEAGGNRTAQARLLWWGIEVAQKHPLWLRVTAHGRGGHGSALNPQSATHRLLAGLGRLLDMPNEYRVTSAAHEYFRALAPFHGETFRRVFSQPDKALVQAAIDDFVSTATVHELLLPGMPVVFLDTLQITAIDSGSSAVNVVPDEAGALVDVRLLPDTDTDAYLGRLREALGEGLDIEVLLRSQSAPASPLDSPIYRALESTLGTRAPVVPIFIPGTTDSRYFRERGIPAYGFSPFTLSGEESKGIHGADESIPINKFQRGVETMRRVVRACVAEGSASAPPSTATGGGRD